MGLNNEGLRDVTWARQRFCVFDIETAPIADVGQFVETGRPPANYTKPETISKWHQENRAKQIADAAVDIDLCRVGCIAFTTEADEEIIAVCNVEQTDEAERAIIEQFWLIAGSRELIGFNILGFDLLVLMRRSLYLDLPVPRLDVSRYRHDANIKDLLDVLSFGRKENMRGLGFYARRFGIPYDDSIASSEMPALIQAGDWKPVLDHVRSDVNAEFLLAKRVGVIRSFEPAEVF